MGAVGAVAPTVFESVGASTHGFWWILSQIHQFHEKNMETISNIVIPRQIEVKHPQFEIPNEDPAILICIKNEFPKIIEF